MRWFIIWIVGFITSTLQSNYILSFAHIFGSYAVRGAATREVSGAQYLFASLRLRVNILLIRNTPIVINDHASRWANKTTKKGWLSTFQFLWQSAFATFKSPSVLQVFEPSTILLFPITLTTPTCVCHHEHLQVARCVSIAACFYIVEYWQGGSRFLPSFLDLYSSTEDEVFKCMPPLTAIFACCWRKS